MSKNKPNKQNDNDNNFQIDPQVEKLIDIETKTDHAALNIEEFPVLSTTIKITNPGEEVKIPAENIKEAGAVKKEEVKVNIVNVTDKEAKKAEKTEKEPVKVSIVDLSQKKADKSQKRGKLHNLLKLPFNDKLDLLNVKIEDKDLEKALDSLIYLGGGVIAVTSLTSKALANIGNYLIKK
jgi:hypothetical protein